MVKVSIGKKVLKLFFHRWNRKFTKLGNKGQMVIEAVLLMTLSIGLLLATTRKIKQEKWMQTMIQGAWEQTAGMIECGVWERIPAAKLLHPNSITRSLTINPDKE